MADVPEDLLDQIKHLEKVFSVDQTKLKEITTHFIKELEKGKSPTCVLAEAAGANGSTGLSVEGGSIVSVENSLNTKVTC